MVATTAEMKVERRVGSTAVMKVVQRVGSMVGQMVATTAVMTAALMAG